MFESILLVARHFVSPAGAFALLVSALLGVVVAGDQFGRSTASKPVADVGVLVRRDVLQNGSDWLSEAYWARKRARRLGGQDGYFSPQSNPFDTGSGEGGTNLRRPLASVRRKAGGYYRTVCVRLCDGYYFPISFSTTRDRFEDDEATCRSSCNADARLFHHPINEAPDAAQFKDRDGRAYGELENAFLYRTRYQASCQCRPQPWSEEARQRHAMYATEEWQKNSARLATAKGAGDRRAASVARPVEVVRAGDAVAQSGITRGDSAFGGSRMGLGRGRDRPTETASRGAPRRESNWRSRVFNTLTD
jgi:hypothetical protein